MSAQTASPKPSSHAASPVRSVVQDSAPSTLEAARTAAERVAPLWPLTRFVAVNPYMGLSDVPFEQAGAQLGHSAGARLTMPRTYYLDAIAAGRITIDDLAGALSATPELPGLPSDVAAFERLLQAAPDGQPPRALTRVSDIAAQCTGQHYDRLVLERICDWAGSYFDARQAAWRNPGATERPFSAWRSEACLDRTPGVWGLQGFRARVAALPDTAEEMLEVARTTLGIPRAGVVDYFHRLLMGVSGWAGRARHRGWEAGLRGGSDDTAVELLAICVAWECLLLQCTGDAVAQRWRTARDAYAFSGSDPATARAIAIDSVLQTAAEHAAQRSLAERLGGPRTAPVPMPCLAQLVFCIDVRSEPLRRALEAQDPSVRTMGAAGFFGFPINYHGLATGQAEPRCPALLAPPLEIEECDHGDAAQLHHHKTRALSAAAAFKQLKSGAASGFGFVETAGFAYGLKLLTDAIGLTRPAAKTAEVGVAPEDAHALSPSIEPGARDGIETGIPSDKRVELAEAALRSMSLTERLPRLVVLVGHASSSTNNPHASGLDCGACGGHGGDANAQVAAAVLNDVAVREGLKARGIDIPHDTRFVAALHDTTTDEVQVLDATRVPQSHRGDVTRLRGWLKSAATSTQRERAERTPIPLCDDAQRRARDWSQPRPEWGLAGCMAFIAARRDDLRGADLAGRVFLQEYDPRQDTDWSVLEGIMTAPMVVGSWIALQYYASTVDNDRFGAGNKALHNVVAGDAVVEGVGGDLRVGLPWQSVHDGSRLIHEPLRLSVMLQAPTDAIESVLSRHPNVRQLVDNGWLHLLCLDDRGHVTKRRQRDGSWQPLQPAVDGER